MSCSLCVDSEQILNKEAVGYYVVFVVLEGVFSILESVRHISPTSSVSMHEIKGLNAPYRYHFDEGFGPFVTDF